MCTLSIDQIAERLAAVRGQQSREVILQRPLVAERSSKELFCGRDDAAEVLAYTCAAHAGRPRTFVTVLDDGGRVELREAGIALLIGDDRARSRRVLQELRQLTLSERGGGPSITRALADQRDP